MENLTTGKLKDDNEEIMNLLGERLKLGRKTYGHGVIVDQDTRKHGTPDNDWELMALEELLDGLIYTTAAIIRHRRKKTLTNSGVDTADTAKSLDEQYDSSSSADSLSGDRSHSSDINYVV